MSGNGLFYAGALIIGAVLLLPNLSAPDEVEAPAADKPAAKRAAGSGTPVSPQAGNGLASREIRRDPDGHFYADAQVNGARVRFMVDTGASMVALTRTDAQRAGIALGNERGRAMGAGGEIEIVPVTIERIAIGSLEARGVRGAMVEQLPVSLLGQSYLEQVGSVEIRGDTMVLR